MSRDNKTPLPLSVALGALLVPLAAIASVLIVRPSEARVSPEEAPGITVSTDSTVATRAFADDVATACGQAGHELVELESAGSATQIQQAALDALRPVCDALGMGLPEPPPEPAPQVPASAPQTASSASPVVSVGGVDDHGEDDDGDEDDEDDDEEDEDDDEEDEDEEEYEYEYEDGEWEVDD